MPKNLLIISYHFPPDLVVGAIRPAKFAQYLPEFGWDVSVLTVFDKYHKNIDQYQQKQQEPIAVYRTGKIPNFSDIYLSLKNFNIPFQHKNNNYQAPQKWTPPKESKRETTLGRLKRYFNSLVVWLPDDKIGWVAPAVLAGLNLIKKNKIDAIFTTCPPNSVHLIGLILKIITQKLWIADFRDPWPNEMKPFFVRSNLSDSIEKWMVRQVVEKSNCVLSVTPEMTEMFLNQYSGKFVTIFNGYDSDELGQYSSVEKYDKFTITYAGTFYLGRNPELFLTALQALISNREIEKDQIHVRFIGSCRYLAGQSIEKIVENLDLCEIVTFVDQIPHHEAVTEMAKSHVLLLLAPDQPLQVPGKLFEYMGLNSFILAVCGPGATMNVLKKYPKAVIVPPANLDAMKIGILTLMRKNNEQTLDVSRSPWQKDFERKDLAKRLAEVLNKS